jgi:hypothetical protein
MRQRKGSPHARRTFVPGQYCRLQRCRWSNAFSVRYSLWSPDGIVAAHGSPRRQAKAEQVNRNTCQERMALPLASVGVSRQLTGDSLSTGDTTYSSRRTYCIYLLLLLPLLLLSEFRAQGLQPKQE